MPSPSYDWNSRYQASGNHLSDKPSAILTEVLPLLPHGHALDIACGPGRNAILLASNGWDVTGVDFSSAGLALARASAQTAGVPVSVESAFAERPQRPRGLHLIEADLEQIALPIHHFDVIVCVNYLQRSLFHSILDALRPGGVFLYETYTCDQLQFSNGPRNPEFLLHPGEIREAFSDLTILFYRELCAGKAIASIVARKTS